MQAALDRGVRFLLESQEAAGSWSDFEVDGAFESDAWVTAYVGHALAGLSAVVGRPIDAALIAARAFLIRALGTRGGWGYCGAAPIDADSTAWAIELLAPCGGVPPQVYDALRAHRRSDGGFATYDRFSDPSMWRGSQADVSALALKALLGERSPDRAAIDACASFLRGCQDADGGWPSYWYQTRHYATAHALDALERYDAPALARCRPRDAARLAVREALPGDPFTLAYALELSLRFGEPDAAGTMAGELQSLQQSDGRWTASEPFMRPDSWNYAPSDRNAAIFDHNGFFTTATVLRALAMAARTVPDREVAHAI
jgi:Prenyltransferase and squalene oxidase repeat